MNDDKLSAYQTLYHCLLTVSRLMAPIAPFYADRLFHDLADGTQHACESVHLARFPQADEAQVDKDLERRMELAMEGHRWFDLVRWEGVAGTGLKAHMDAYKASESAEVQGHIQEFVAGKHEIFPIPQEERQLNPTYMEQNPGY